MNIKINKVDHICIAVKNLEFAAKNWEFMLGKKGPDESYVDDNEKINVFRYFVGEIAFELMESISYDGPVAKWIDKRGEGIMLISFNVDNTRKFVNFLRDKSYSFIKDSKDNVIRPFRDCEFAFINPKHLNGVLTELIDYKWKK